MNIILIILRALVTLLNSMPHLEKKVTLELNNQYVIELNVTQFHVKEKLPRS